MKQAADWILTRREALRVLGIGNHALSLLERLAKISSGRKRHGYNKSELKKLKTALRVLSKGFINHKGK